ncbi:MAG: DUF1843 domain-containing protein [Alphaproteobacteria bacterium]|nr:DUF1843 domain-containing protein [Alphaproteobacteria bacterium]MBV9372670.1 DUF1843 domain-containing protein [Alphaproteobacteria bacterium]MBV9900180.1 DUF1843 domain-containing protein [Alphaproteobacteria bacterium]
MAQASGGRIPLYGVVISDALKDPNSSLESLSALRDQARRQLEEQGDLPSALKKVEAEIARRGTK